VIKDLQIKLPYYRPDMTRVGQKLPLILTGFLSVDPPIFSYSIRQNYEMKQTFSVELKDARWHHRQVSEETHPDLFKRKNVWSGNEAFRYTEEVRIGVIAESNRTVTFGEKSFMANYPQVTRAIGFRVPKESNTVKAQPANVFVLVESQSVVKAGDLIFRKSQYRKSVEVFLYLTGERLVYMDAFGDVPYTEIGGWPYLYGEANAQMPFLIWQPNLTEAIAIDLRPILPRKNN
jgi:hypothetical protein